MKNLTFVFLLVLTVVRVSAQTPEHEKLVRAYYAGFEKHNWNITAAALAPDFTFTSPAPDNHINLKEFHEKCWPTNRFFESVNLLQMTEKGNDLYLLVEIKTTDHKTVRNIDRYQFKNGKIAAIECFFGYGEGYPGHKK